MTDETGNRQERLEHELASVRAELGRTTDSATAERLKKAVKELEKKLERMLLAIEIERQSDA